MIKRILTLSKLGRCRYYYASIPKYAPFQLDRLFIQKYTTEKTDFGFNGLGEVTYLKSYSRLKDNNEKEKWFETIKRVVEGTHNMQLEHCKLNNIICNMEDLQLQAQRMYCKMYSMKFLPPGRGLWSMGTSLIHKKHLYAALNNCGFISTKNISENPTEPFTFLFDAGLIGIGVGYDLRGGNKIKINKPTDQVYLYTIDDSREGWVDSIKVLLESYFYTEKPTVVFDYVAIRPAGAPLKTFGGVASGPQPLLDLHISIRNYLQKIENTNLSERGIVDVMNMIGRCVSSSNIRRSSQMPIGDATEEFLNLKNYEINPERKEYGWVANHTVSANFDMDYTKLGSNIVKYGEPGIMWLENMKNYSRMIDPKDKKDIRVEGGNPCLEQSLESSEVCCLVDVFISRHKTYEEFEETLLYAYLYAKTVTIGMTTWDKTNEILKRNRRIGCSVGGLAEFLSDNSYGTLKEWLNNGYRYLREIDKEFSSKWKIPESIKITSVKPSGSVSLLAGVTPGIHFPWSKYYIKRLSFSFNSELLEILRKSNYPVETSLQDSKSKIVSFPVHYPMKKNVQNITMMEQLELAAFLQKYWADNQVSCTITFDPETEGHLIPQVLTEYQHKLKGITFFPRSSCSSYKQTPYEEIDEEKYKSMVKRLKPLNFENNTIIDNINSKELFFCSNDLCTV